MIHYIAKSTETLIQINYSSAQSKVHKDMDEWV